MHQLARAVIDENQQTTFIGPIFKPGVVGAINLDQLAQTVTAITGLVHTGFAP
jgi:hypothetical protein